MDELARTIDAGVANKEYGSLVTAMDSLNRLGQGEQRALAAHLIKTSIQHPTLLPEALGVSNELRLTYINALKQLPATVEGAADNRLRQMLFEYMVQQEDDYAGAARILGGMRMETNKDSVYYMTAADICDVYVKIAECFLEEDETVEADAAVNKAGTVVESIDNPEQHMPLILRYKSTYARVLDNNRKFLSAASRYHDLSSPLHSQLIEADDLLAMLGRAATCAILAPSGPQRHRVLGLVYKDERLKLLDSLPQYETHSHILAKMYKHQVLQPHELTKFEATLQPHQQATNSHGLSILQQAVMEHNMIAVSKLYKTIHVQELARLLGVSVQMAEKIAANMIREGSLLHGASLDQVDGILQFEEEDYDVGSSSLSVQETWDKSITSFCVGLNKVAELVQAD